MKKLILHRPDEGFTEYFTWKTAISTSITNREVRDSVIDYPNETVSLEFTVTGAAEMMPTDTQSVGTRFDVFSDALTVRDEVSLPMWHMMSPLADQVLVDSLTLTAVATDDRFTLPISSTGEQVLVSVNGVWVLASAALSSSNDLLIKFASHQYGAPDKFTHVVPVRDGLISTSSFGSAGHYGPSKYKLDALLYRSEARTVLEPFHVGSVGAAGKLALVERNLTNGSTLSVNSGMLRVETADGFPAHRSLWGNSRIEFDFTSEFPPARLKSWRTFMDLVRGSESDFWLPLWDLSFQTDGYGQGGFYAADGYERFWAASPYKSAAVEFADSSVQIVTVRGTRTVEGRVVCIVDSILTGTVVRVAVAVLARVSDDVFRFQHFQAFSSVSFKATAIRNDYSISAIGSKLVEIYGTNINNVHSGAMTVSAANAGTRGNAFSGAVYTSYWNAKEAWSTSGTDGLRYTGPVDDFTFLLTKVKFGVSFRIEVGSSYGGTECLLNLGSGFKIGLDTAGHVICYRRGRTIVSSAVLSFGSRHTLVFTPGDYSDLLYIDGTFDAESSGTFSEGGVASTLTIGLNHSGKIARFELYSRSQEGSLAAFIATEFEGEYPTVADDDYLVVDTSRWDYVGGSAQATETYGRDGGPDITISGNVVGLGIDKLTSAYFEYTSDFGTFAQDLSSWTKYFNGLSDWTISFVAQFGPTSSGICRVIDGGRSTGGIQLEFNGDYLQTVFNGPSSTYVTHSAYTGSRAGKEFVCRIVFTSETKTLRTFVNGVKVAEESVLSFTFSNVNMGSAPRFAAGDDWAVPELRLTPGSVDYTSELKTKWFTSLWADVLTTDDGDLMFDSDDAQLVVTYE